MVWGGWGGCSIFNSRFPAASQFKLVLPALRSQPSFRLLTLSEDIQDMQYPAPTISSYASHILSSHVIIIFHNHPFLKTKHTPWKEKKKPHNITKFADAFSQNPPAAAAAHSLTPWWGKKFSQRKFFLWKNEERPEYACTFSAQNEPAASLPSSTGSSVATQEGGERGREVEGKRREEGTP